MEEKSINEVAENSAVESKKPQRKWLRGILIAVGIILCVVMLTLTAVVIWLGPITERVVERYDKELVGRQLQMSNLRIKLFKGELSVDSLRLYEANDSTTFVTLNRFDTKLELREIFDNHIRLSHITLGEPSAQIVQRPTSFNFDDMLEYISTKYTSTEEEEVEEGEPWKISIENIKLERGLINYVDTELDQQWLLSELNLGCDSLLLKDAMTHLNASMQINRQAELGGEVGINLETLDFTFDGALRQFQLSDIYKYVVPVVNLRELYGSLSTNLTMVGNANDIMATNIRGKLSVDDLHITAHDGGNVLTANNISTQIRELNLDKERYIFDSLTASGYSTQFIMRKDGTTNFDQLFYDEPEVSIETTSEEVGAEIYDQRERVTITTSESVAPFSGMTLYIAHLNLAGGNLLFADQTMQKEFKYRLQNISIESKNFDMAKRNKLTVRATTNNQGSALVHWEGSLNDFYNQSILASLSNVNMKDFTPYTEHYTAFPITSGNLTFRSQNIITNGEISGINRLGTYDFGVGKKDKSLDPEYKLPLKLGVYVLTDKDKHIDIDLPISGNINEPEFSLRKVIFKAIGNLLLKVAASPFSWMSSDKQDTFKHINFDLLDPSLTSEQYARLDNMAAALKEDSSLKVRLKQSINYERAEQEIADLNLKMAYYNSTQVEADKRLDMVDFVRINEMRLSTKDVVEFADSQLIARGIDPTHMNTHAKAKALYGDVIDRQIVMMSEARCKIIRDYISFQHKDLSAESFIVENMTLDQMKEYHNKPRFNVTLIIDDEEVNIESEEDEKDEEKNKDAKEDNKANADALAEDSEEKTEEINK
ncbi:MAG: DUF748 domain-containing protein [Alistipes sp.]|nr:DUF748 domain-containing protein [Alistipes sp.]